MKTKFLYTIATILMLLILGCGSDAPPKVKNTAPSVPSLINPTNNNLCISNAVSFEWNASTDAEKNPIVYQLEVATDNQFTQMVSNSEMSNPYKTLTLEKGKAYYWRVKATDSNNLASNYSTTFSFYTEGTAITNHLPFLPQLVAPLMDASVSGVTATLQWTASDVDAQDQLTYDVYLGTTNSPTNKIGNNINTATAQATTLQAATTYYWKVVVKDNKGGETIGPVWSFKTN